MTIKDYLSHVTDDELINRLKLIDQSLYELHQHGLYVVSNISDIEIYNNEVTLASFKDKVDYLNSGINEHGDKQDILELCSIGVCAFNKFDNYYSSREFMAYLMDHLDNFVSNNRLPEVMQEYYIDVFARGNVSYLNDFILDYESSKENDGGKNSKYVKTKTTAVGKALSGMYDEAAYARVLILPAILTLVYLLALVSYFVFFR